MSGRLAAVVLRDNWSIYYKSIESEIREKKSLIWKYYSFFRKYKQQQKTQKTDLEKTTIFVECFTKIMTTVTWHYCPMTTDTDHIPTMPVPVSGVRTWEKANCWDFASLRHPHIRVNTFLKCLNISHIYNLWAKMEAGKNTWRCWKPDSEEVGSLCELRQHF